MSEPKDQTLNESLEAVWNETIQLSGTDLDAELDSAAEASNRTYQPQPSGSWTPGNPSDVGSGLQLPSLSFTGSPPGMETVVEDESAGNTVHKLDRELSPGETAATLELADGGLSSAEVTVALSPEESSGLVAPSRGTAPLAKPCPTYELAEVIGKGGMGVVYRAQQSSLQRDVALKRLHRKAGDGRARQRFLAEAVINGRLDHPNIVPVYDLGLEGDGEAALAMKLVDGVEWAALLHPKTEAERARAASYGLNEHLGVLIQVCNAVAFAHSRGVVHNDLKPSNVMLGEFGEVLVMDWGLACDVREEPDPNSIVLHKSQIEHPCGTPAYMPPELAEGHGSEIGPRTDVYLLGSILHEILSGRPPHQAKTMRAVITKAVRSRPPSFEGIEVAEELAEVCRRAMSRKPAGRYASVTELREALEAYLTHRESLRSAEAADALLADCRGRCEGSATFAHDKLYADFAETIAGYGQALLLWDGNEAARTQRREARLLFARAAFARGDLGVAEAQLTHLAADDSDAQALREATSERRLAVERAERTGRALRIGLVAAVATIVIGLSAGLLLVRSAQQETAAEAERAREAQGVAEDQRRQAAIARDAAEVRYGESLLGKGLAQGTTGRWGEARHSFRHARGVLRKHRKQTLGADLALLKAAVASVQPAHTLQLSSEANALGFTPEGALVAALQDGSLQAIDPLRGVITDELATGLGAVRSLAISPVSSWIAVGGDAGRLNLVPLSEGGRHAFDREPRLLRGHEGAVLALDIDRAGQHVFSAGEDKIVREWSLVTGEEVFRYERHEHSVTGVRLMGDERYFFSGDASGDLVWWNRKGKSPHWPYDRSPARLRPPSLPLVAMAFAPRRGRLAFATRRDVHVWAHNKHANNFVPYLRLEAHQGPVIATAFSPRNDHLITVGADAQLIEWNVETNYKADSSTLPRTPKPLRKISLAGAGLAVAIDAQGRWVAVSSRGGVVELFDLGLAWHENTGTERRRLPLAFLHPEPPKPEPRSGRPAPPPPTQTCVALSSDSRLAISGQSDGKLTLWEATLGRPLHDLVWHTGRVLAVSFLGDDVASVGAEGWVRTWSTGTTFAPRHTLQLTPEPADGSPAARATHAAFSPNGQHLAIVINNELIRVDPLAGREQSRVALRSPASAVGVADDGRALIAHTDGTLTRFRSASASGAAIRRSGEAASAVLLGDRWFALGTARGELELHFGNKPAVARSAHRDAITSLRALPSSEEAKGAEAFASASLDGTWRVWSVVPLRELAEFTTKLGPLNDVAVGTRLIAAGERLAGWPFDEDRERARLQGALAAAPESKLALATWLASQRIFRPALRLLAGHEAPLVRVSAAWELGLRHTALEALATHARSQATPDTYTSLLQRALTRELALKGSLIGTTRSPLRGLTYDAKKNTVIYANRSARVEEREVDSGHLRRVVAELFPEDPRSNIDIRTLARRNHDLALGTQQGHVYRWDLRSGEQRWVVRPAGWKGVARTLNFSEDGERLFTVCSDRLLRVYSVADGSMLETASFKGLPRLPTSLALSPGDERVAVSYGKQVAIYWGADLRAEPTTFEASKGDVIGLGFLDAERLIGWCQRETRFRTWDLKGKLLSESEVEQGISAVVYDLKRQRALTGTTAGFGRKARAVVWDLATGRPIKHWTHDRSIWQVCFAREGKAAVLGLGAGDIVLHPLDK